MDKLDSKIRQFLVDEGYLFPITDAEINRALKESQSNPIEIPIKLDNPLIFLNRKREESHIITSMGNTEPSNLD